MQYGIPQSYIDEETRKQMFQRGLQPIKSRPGDFAKMGFGGEGIAARNPFGRENSAYKERFPDIKTPQQAFALSKDPIKLRSYGITEEDALAFAKGMLEKGAGIESERESIKELMFGSEAAERKRRGLEEEEAMYNLNKAQFGLGNSAESKQKLIRKQLGLQIKPPIKSQFYEGSRNYGGAIDSSYKRMIG